MATQDNIVPAADAGARFAELLELVQAGEEIIITKNGGTIAKIVPAGPDDVTGPEEREKAINRWLEIAKDIRLGNDLDLEDMINEGRR